MARIACALTIVKSMHSPLWKDPHYRGIDVYADKLARAKYFTKMDLNAGFHQIRLNDDSVAKSAFRLPEPVRGAAQYEWLVMPFGLTNAPPTFQRVMQLALRDCDDVLEIYIDDLMIHSMSYEQHVLDVRRVLAALRREKLQVKRSKCEFAKTTMSFLGHVLGNGGISVDPAKVQAARNLEIAAHIG